MPEWRRICCPVDFSEPAREAMRTAAWLAGKHEAELVLVHAYQLPGVAFPESSAFAGPGVLDRLLEAIDRQLAEWRGEAESLGASPVTAHTATGVPWVEIVRFAEEGGCDVLVMGTHGRSAIARAILGSVAEKVVRHAPCPVLTVRPRRLELPAPREPTAP